MDIYSSGKKQQTMLLCNVGHGIEVSGRGLERSRG